MADLQHSRVLFVTDHGQQMRFYIVPSDDKLLVKPIIEVRTQILCFSGWCTCSQHFAKLTLFGLDWREVCKQNL